MYRDIEALYGIVDGTGSRFGKLGFVGITNQFALELVTWCISIFTRTNTQHFEVRGLHQLVRDNKDANLVTLFKFQDGTALLIQEEGSYIHRHLGVNLLGIVLERFFFNKAQNGQCQRFVITNGTLPHATWADVGAGLVE